MTLNYHLNLSGIPEGVRKLILSFVWTIIALGFAYVSTRLELLNTTESIGLAVAIRTLVSGVFAYLKTAGSLSVNVTPTVEIGETPTELG